MIPLPVVTAWRKQANWPQDEQVEQDLIISRALVELFSHPYIKDKVAFRGGTALHKLIFPKALRYSEDIDLNRLEESPDGPLIDAVIEVMKPIFPKRPNIDKKKTFLKMIYKYDSVSGQQKKLKIEINIKETLPQKKLESVPFQVDSEFFTGKSDLQIFDREEMIGTKIRALYQRNKGRDLFDLFEARTLGLNWDTIVESFKLLGENISKQNLEENLSAKMENQEFMDDIKPLLPTDIKYAPQEAYEWFTGEIIPRL
jgi:predicted nucleotidyltransferase component of viral defense system